MERELFGGVKAAINRLGFYRKRPAQTHSDGAVLAVYFWAVLNDRPVCWACDRANWPTGRWRGRLPTQSCMSRRMNGERFRDQLRRVERAARPEPGPVTLAACLDAKPLTVAWHSADPHAGTGRGAGGLARGYKLHAITDAGGRLLAWRLASLNADERTMAPRLLRDLAGVCYVVADAGYNANHVFHAASARGARLVSPRKRSHEGGGLGRRVHHADRLRSIELLEDGRDAFAEALLNARGAIERFFANLTNFGGGLTCLPAWVRTYPRVFAWTADKITLMHLRQRRKHHPQAA